MSAADEESSTEPTTITPDSDEEATTEGDSLMRRYLDVVNRALEAHRDEFPFEQIIEAGEKLAEDSEIGVSVYKTDPGNPHDSYTIAFSDERFELVAHGQENPDIGWKVKEEYLEKVVDHPQRYIENPAKLDFDWLWSRLGIE
jgi:hypothetical protein